MMKQPEAVCKDKRDYVKIALAIETLAYHNKNYLWTGNDGKINEEMQALFNAAIVESQPGSDSNICRFEDEDVYLDPSFSDLWVVHNKQLIKINDGYEADISDHYGYIKVGHIDVDAGFGANNIEVSLMNEKILFHD